MTLTFDGLGNGKGPTRYHDCQRCGKRKPETNYRHYPTGNREKVCRACRRSSERHNSKRTPIHVKRASAMGRGSDRRWATERCPQCGEPICWDTTRDGTLLALNGTDRNPHPHQPPYKNPLQNGGTVV